MKFAYVLVFVSLFALLGISMAQTTLDPVLVDPASVTPVIQNNRALLAQVGLPALVLSMSWMIGSTMFRRIAATV